MVIQGDHGGAGLTRSLSTWDLLDARSESGKNMKEAKRLRPLELALPSALEYFPLLEKWPT